MPAKPRLRAGLFDPGRCDVRCRLGQGLLARCICLIAYGRQPHAVTLGEKAEEREKRLVAELIGGGPALFLDNLNNTVLKSDLLASAITERPARGPGARTIEDGADERHGIQVMTGNGLSVSEDLARRFLTIELDAKVEDPEARRFEGDIRAEVKAEREALLAAALTIWRWGQLATDLSTGRPSAASSNGAVGCAIPCWLSDAAIRLSASPRRSSATVAGRPSTELFKIWWKRHAEAVQSQRASCTKTSGKPSIPRIADASSWHRSSKSTQAREWQDTCSRGKCRQATGVGRPRSKRRSSEA